MQASVHLPQLGLSTSKKNNPALSVIDEWRGVAGFVHYQVSRSGQVRSLDRYQANGRLRKSTLLKRMYDKDGYPQVNLHRGKGPEYSKVHRLVAITFHGAAPPGKVARHLNGVRTDCRASNLAWGTHKENSDDRTLHGNSPLGEKHARAVLDEQKVRLCRKLRAQGFTYRSISDTVGGNMSAIVHMLAGRTWSHVK